jgi:hypothetical protein
LRKESNSMNNEDQIPGEIQNRVGTKKSENKCILETRWGDGKAFTSWHFVWNA